MVEWLVVDDGSTDRTLEVARKSGVDHIVSFPKNWDLAKAFMAGLQAALQTGADIIVNIDADNEYCAEDIPKLITPNFGRESGNRYRVPPHRPDSTFLTAKNNPPDAGQLGGSPG